MALSVVQFLVLLGAAVAVPPSGRYFSPDPWSRKAVPEYRETVDPWSRKAVPEYRETADVMCRHKVANTLKLAIVYSELSATMEPLYSILHDLYIEPDMANMVTSLLSSARVMQPRYLLDTTYSHRVPMLLWAVSELRPAFVERAPSARMVERFSRKLSADCSVLMSEREVITLMDYLTKAESAFIAEVKGIMSRLPASSDVTTRLMSRIEVVATTMAWARNLVNAEIAIPARIITYWIETRRPYAESAGSSSEESWESWESPEATWESPNKWESWESPNKWEATNKWESWGSKDILMADAPMAAPAVSVRLPRPTEVRCYSQKVDMYKLLLLNCLVGLDSMSLEKTLERAMTSPELGIKPAEMAALRQQLPLKITEILRRPHLKIADIFREPSVAAVLHVARPKFEVFMDVHMLRSMTSEPARLARTLQAAVDVIMTSDKLCAVNAKQLSHNLTAIISHIQERMRLSEIKAAVKPVLARHIHAVKVGKMLSMFESRYMAILDVHKSLVRCLSADLSTVTPRPEGLVARYASLLASSTGPRPALLYAAAPETDILVSSLGRVAVDVATPMLLVPGPLLREVIMNVAVHLTPTSAPCARLAAIKIAAAFSRTAIVKELSYEERFIELLAKKTFQSRISPEEIRLIAEEIRKVMLGKIESTFTDEGIKKAEMIFKDVLALQHAEFEKPVPEVMRPLVEKMKTVVSTVTCTENVGDIREKTLVAMINSLTTPLAASDIEAIVKKAVKNSAQEGEVVALLTRVMPELTGGLLEEVQLLRQYVEEAHIKNFPLVLADCIVRVLSEVSPVPMVREMTALFPRESPMAIVIQPRARRLTRHITTKLFESLKTKGVEVPKEELDLVIKTVIAKLNKLGFKSAEPSNESFKPTISYDVAERTLSVLGDVTLEAASPSVIRHVVSLAVRDLEEANLRPECLNAARVKLMAGVLRVLLERHVLMSTPESGMFVTVYKIMRPEVQSLEEIQKVSGVIAATLRTKVTEAMAGLSMFTDTARTEEVVHEVLRLPYERLSGLTLRELLVEPLSKMKAFYKDVSSCSSFNMEAFTREVDTFTERWAQMALTKADFTKLLTPVMSDRALLEKVCSKLEEIVLPEVRHHVATAFMFTRNAITAPSPAVFRRFFGRIIINAFGLTSPAPLRGFLEQPLFDVFTTELYTELTYKLTALKVARPEAEHLLNEAMIRALEEQSIPAPMLPYEHPARGADNQL